MNKTISYVIIVVCGAVFLVTALVRPSLISDDNEFLKELIGVNLLTILGVILSITLASVGQVHLSLNKIEEKYNKRAFPDTRAGMQKAAYWLISLFLICLIVTYAKSAVPSSPAWEAIMNGAALVILLWYLLILISIMQMIFAIQSDIDY